MVLLLLERMERLMLQVVISLFFPTGQTAVKLSGAEAADRAQCAAPDCPTQKKNRNALKQCFSCHLQKCKKSFDQDRQGTTVHGATAMGWKMYWSSSVLYFATAGGGLLGNSNGGGGCRLQVRLLANGKMTDDHHIQTKGFAFLIIIIIIIQTFVRQSPLNQRCW